MENENTKKIIIYGVTGLILILVLIAGLTILRGRCVNEGDEPSASENKPAIVASQEQEEAPKLTRNAIIDQLIGTITAETFSYKKDSLLRQLEEYDPRDALVWETILKYYEIANSEGFVNTYEILPIRPQEEEESDSQDSGAADAQSEDGEAAEIPAPPTIEEMLARMDNKEDPLPGDLPDDDSLCFVILGFQLNADGSIRQELVNRLTAGYLCAQQYPNAYILTTGGPTASADRNATEAEAMADYLVANGIDAGRLIVENASLTTYENAIYSCGILSTQYPQVEHIVVVSSDYHIPMGCLLFEAQSLIDTCDLEGMTEIHVIGNVGCLTNGRYYFGASSQASQLKSLSY